MSEISDAIQDKCLAFGDRIIKLNDDFDNAVWMPCCYLLSVQYGVFNYWYKHG